VEQVSALLTISVSSVYEKTRTRPQRGGLPRLPHLATGRYLRFIESEVVAWLLALPPHAPRPCRKKAPKKKAA
jgi:predicted DNA-binding transcriptional regulator AlpA